MRFLRQLAVILRLVVTPRTDIILENIALRQQLGVLSRRSKRPRLNRRDRMFWVWLSCIWNDWRTSLVIVKPDTVVGWHRKGWRLYWRRKSRAKTGRPQIDREVRDLVRRMAHENSLWGAPRIHRELLKLGFTVAQATVAKYVPKRDKSPSPT